jgi:hypothetical protein
MIYALFQNSVYTRVEEEEISRRENSQVREKRRDGRNGDEIM